MGDVLLVGCQMWDDVERQLKLTCPSNYHLLLLIHVGTNDIAMADLEYMKNRYRAPWAKVGVQVMLSSFLKAKGKSPNRSGQFLQKKVWLHDWYPRQHLGFYDHGTLLSNEGY